MFDKTVWITKKKFYLSFKERMQNLITIVRCSNFLQIFMFLNSPALSYKTQSMHLIGILIAFQAFVMSCFGQ